MVWLKKWVWAAVAAAATAAPAVAQQGGVTSGGGRPTGTLGGVTLGGGGLTQTTVGGLGGSGGLNTIGPSGGATGGGGLGGGGAQGGLGSELGGTQLLQMQQAPQLAPPTGTATSPLSPSNPFSGYYANPYFQGQIRAQLNAVPGGFGTPLYPTTGAGAGGAGGALNRAGALGGGLAGGGLAGRQAGLGGLGQNANTSGIVVPLPVQIAYTAEVRFPTTPVAPAAIQADLRGVIDRAPMIASPQNVQVVVAGGNNVTLRGTVRDEDEARLVEGLVRLTPGVGEIRNELTFPTAGK